MLGKGLHLATPRNRQWGVDIEGVQELRLADIISKIIVPTRIGGRYAVSKRYDVVLGLVAVKGNNVLVVGATYRVMQFIDPDRS